MAITAHALGSDEHESYALQPNGTAIQIPAPAANAAGTSYHVQKSNDGIESLRVLAATNARTRAAEASTYL